MLSIFFKTHQMYQSKDTLVNSSKDTKLNFKSNKKLMNSLLMIVIFNQEVFFIFVYYIKSFLKENKLSLEKKSIKTLLFHWRIKVEKANF